MRGRIWPWLLLVLAFLPALLIQRPQERLAPVTSHVFTEVIFQSPGNVDPALASSPADWQVASNVFQTLLTVSPTGRLEPGLASAVSYQGNTVKIELRPARLSNGRRITADLVAEALVRPLVAPVNSSAAQHLLAEVVGTNRFEHGQAHYVQGIAVNGPLSLQLTLKKPVTTTFLQNLANPVLAIVPVSDQSQGGQNWQFTNLIGTGGYALTQWTPGDHLSFSKVSGSGPQAVNLEVYSQLNQALLAYQNGLVNAVPIAPTALSRLTRRELTHVQTLTQPGVVTLYINAHQSTAAMSRINIRHWVSKAFRGLLPPLSPSTRLPSHGQGPFVVWVDRTDSQAVQLAQSLVTLSRGRIAIQQTTAAHLATVAKNGQIGAYIGQHRWFTHGTSVELVKRRSFWLFSQSMPHAEVLSHQVLSWHSVP
ncbi:ABC transporter substrate-binding protein [Sulfobacillus sp. hq2]|uniref:ABC transporter substrate-binding protein n=1 Tax=Sulfobacillus TaxID=28033 RepID=UPI000CD140DC|nr:ABC transporter substrate-binding protein [Sulfobacillus sp. hq2]POB11628.1 hypothetical protein CO251_03375 [Sulfobacillus sp. hq2]